ncbi:MAG: DUF6088 family protein [Clostridiales bacterium]|nr:DUF6088 family protein [Clostridiales bacterium]
MGQRPKYLIAIKERIDGMEKGTALTAADFSDIAGTDAVNKALSRLCEEGTIRRIMHGMYDIPVYSKMLQEYAAPRINQVAEALARKYQWSIAPGGDASLNLLHVSTQVPKAWIYISDGPYRQYHIDGTTLIFQKRTKKDLSGINRVSSMIAEAFKTLGKARVDDDVIQTIRLAIPEPERKTILLESESMTGWIRENIKKICEVPQ